MDTKTKDIKRESSIISFLWWCSGAEIELLRQLPSEKQKYLSIGTTVFMTSVFAVLSSSYAFYTVFLNTTIAIVFGLMWGILIFTLDRYAVSTVAKTSSTSKTFLTALPSIFLSILIAIVISTPLSLRIFDKQIELEHLSQVHQKNLSANSEFGKEQVIINQKISTLQNDTKEKEMRLSNRLKEYEVELAGIGGSRNQGYGPLSEFKKRQYEIAKIEYENTKAQNDSLTFSLNKEILNLSEKINSTEKLYSSQMTFFDMIQSLSDLRGKNTTINLVSFFLLLLIILISSAPIFIQIFSREGPYNEYVYIRAYTS